MKKRLLICKRGALGDVVRTSYFARALKERWQGQCEISWLTAPNSAPLLQFNPWIDRVVTSFDDCHNVHYDHIFSLDDELDALAGVSALPNSRITGAYLENGCSVYSPDSAPWFDMGLLSRFGKPAADKLKVANCRGHAEILCEIFDVKHVRPGFYGDPAEEGRARHWLDDDYFNIAVNPFAGGRWPSKELRPSELRKLVAGLVQVEAPDGRPTRVVLLGAGADADRNNSLVAEFGDSRIRAAGTDSSILLLAAIIGASNVLISSDSLALHLGIAQAIPFIAFFAPTSAAEIDDFDLGLKVVSTARDYCSYKPDADNSTITADRLMAGFVKLTRRL